MTIGHVSELNAMLSKLGLYGNAMQATAAGSPSGAAASMVAPSAQSGGLLGSVVQALSQIGVSGAPSALGAASSGSSSGSQSASQQNASQALKSFMQSLLTALQTQAAANSAQQGANVTSAASASGAGRHHGHGHGHGQHGVGGGLQSLILELSASSSAATSATSAASATSATSAASAASGNATTTAANATLASLQQSFNQLVSAVGGGGSQASLGNFLTTLAGDLSTGAHTGALVSTHA